MKFFSLMIVAAFAIACGDSREEPAPAPVDESAPVTADPGSDEVEVQVGLSDVERARLEKQYAAEAKARITAENAEEVGTRMLEEVERELAAELAAAGKDAGTD